MNTTDQEISMGDLRNLFDCLQQTIDGLKADIAGKDAKIALYEEMVAAIITRVELPPSPEPTAGLRRRIQAVIDDYSRQLIEREA